MREKIIKEGLRCGYCGIRLECDEGAEETQCKSCGAFNILPDEKIEDLAQRLDDEIADKLRGGQ